MATAAHAATIAHDIASMLNNERAANHLPPLKANAKLVSSAHAHNLQMASNDALSHQLRGEKSLGDRISATGLRWSYAGENIGYNTDWSRAGARYLEQKMYDERPPGETGHRENILSRNYTAVGVDVYYDAKHHTLWLTEDFAKS